jgi:DNA-binding MarR family transcriptional regulator
VTTSPPPASRSASRAVGTRLAAEAWESLFRTQVTIMRRLQADDIWHDVTMREYDVLFTLSRAPGGELRLRDLNAGILLAQSSLSRLVERLEARGLVARSVPADDARGTLVGLTPEGARLQRETGRAHVRTIADYVGQGLEPAELEELTALLDRLRAAQAAIPDRSAVRHEPAPQDVCAEPGPDPDDEDTDRV